MSGIDDFLNQNKIDVIVLNTDFHTQKKAALK